jgi:2-polyprenyl-6-methoxyphenol hydroxylase-like FAD-dependent oxidoreductase
MSGIAIWPPTHTALLHQQPVTSRCLAAEEPLTLPGEDMLGRIETKVLIVGAGPVGMTLALDLAWRGVDVTVAELRPAGEPPSVKCNQISARSMEIFRRLGIARKLREAGLPADYPNDVVSATTVTGIELARVPIPSRAERYTAKDGPDTSWPTPEPTHRINQKYFEPVLFASTASHPRIRLLNRTAVEDFAQDEHRVSAVARNLDSGEQLSIGCSYLVGCDGAKSGIRKKIGAKLTGTPEVQRVQSTCIRAPELADRLPGKRAWMYFSLNPRRCGTTIAIDGRKTWQIHNTLYDGETEFDTVDRDWAIRTILGVGPDFRYEVVSKEDWVGRRLVADRFQDQRAFICGDAAHLWIPHAGYGMNAGIADAANLSWMIAAALSGWAPPAILDAYEAERQPVADQVSRFTQDSASRARTQHREIPAEIEWRGPIGDAMRARIGGEAYDLAVRRQCAGGLNFGYFYEDSPIIAYDGEPHPAYTMRDFTSSTVPGCRAPHLWLGDGRSLYDALGPGYTLIRFDPTVHISGIVEAAVHRGVPLAVLDVGEPDARALYARKLVLVRPDQHVAWRGDGEPSAPMDLIDLVRGAATSSTPTRRAPPAEQKTPPPMPPLQSRG